MGDYLVYPKMNYVLQITEVFQDKKKDSSQWFSYFVINGIKDAGHVFEHQAKKHNGWDYNNYLLTGWKKLEPSDAIKVLYGKSI